MFDTLYNSHGKLRLGGLRSTLGIRLAMFFKQTPIKSIPLTIIGKLAASQQDIVGENVGNNRTVISDPAAAAVTAKFGCDSSLLAAAGGGKRRLFGFQMMIIRLASRTVRQPRNDTMHSPDSMTSRAKPWSHHDDGDCKERQEGQEESDRYGKGPVSNLCGGNTRETPVCRSYRKHN